MAAGFVHGIEPLKKIDKSGCFLNGEVGKFMRPPSILQEEQNEHFNFLPNPMQEVIMKKIFVILISFVLVLGTLNTVIAKDLEIQGKKLISQNPPFTLTLPSGFNLAHSFSHENPGMSSLTRVFLLVKEKNKRVEEMLILQISDKTNPQAGPITVPSLKPYAEKRLYSKGKLKKGELEIDYLIQLMAWNPNTSSLQAVIQKGFVIPSHWALQAQFLFVYLGEHAVFFRYSKDINSFGVKTSEEGKDWEKELISGNEKKVYEVFQKTFMEIIDSIIIKPLS